MWLRTEHCELPKPSSSPCPNRQRMDHLSLLGGRHPKSLLIREKAFTHSSSKVWGYSPAHLHLCWQLSALWIRMSRENSPPYLCDRVMEWGEKRKGPNKSRCCPEESKMNGGWCWSVAGRQQCASLSLSPLRLPSPHPPPFALLSIPDLV